MIDPLVSLAFSLHSNKGTYALLVGSGISRSAGIPTGWEITLELVEKLAAVSGDETNGDPEQWFRDTHGREPDYSELLDGLAKSAAERQQYLKGFFEPTEQEREEGLKQPTDAHHAIADLMQQGYVKVVVTTNFDRLLEQALETRGIVPTVVSNADQVRGMLPLVHQSHCIIKVHGDYLDTRIKNTSQELESYSPELDDLLDQVIDQFGLVTCGWSGDWDPALRSAIDRAPSRRFSSYWASRGRPSDAANKLIKDRGLHILEISDADSFFRNLAENVQALSDSNRSHPLSAQAAVASAKRYLAEDRYRIRLSDLLQELLDNARANWSASGANVSSPQPSDEEIVRRIKIYDDATEVLLRVAVELGRWARPEYFNHARELLRKLTTSEPRQGSYFPLWEQLSRYPATLFVYAAGISALQAGNYPLIGSLFSVPVRDRNGKNVPSISELAPMCLVDDKASIQPLFHPKTKHTPLSDWLEIQMRNIIDPTSSADEYNDGFASQFDQFELLVAISYRALMRAQKDWLWAPYGCWGWRHRRDDSLLEAFEAELENSETTSVLLQTGIFAGGKAEALEVLKEVRQFAGELRLW
ncbi:MAG: SIR2 family protein [Erythrobacter sp.]